MDACVQGGAGFFYGSLRLGSGDGF